MVFGRAIGWLLVALAVVMASADAVVALSPAEYAGIATGEVVQLLTGDTPVTGGVSVLSAAEAMVMRLPAWMAVGVMGTGLLVACRKRQRRWRFRR